MLCDVLATLCGVAIMLRAMYRTLASGEEALIALTAAFASILKARSEIKKARSEN
jgi:hypothetical protein